jgi:hypothetical protein
LRSDAEDGLAALDLFARFADQKVGFTDCASFALMRRHRLSRAFTFDRHFLAAGFEVFPPPTFAASKVRLGISGQTTDLELLASIPFPASD